MLWRAESMRSSSLNFRFTLPWAGTGGNSALSTLRLKNTRIAPVEVADAVQTYMGATTFVSVPATENACTR
jgi:hypothetical protein